MNFSVELYRSRSYHVAKPPLVYNLSLCLLCSNVHIYLFTINQLLLSLHSTVADECDTMELWKDGRGKFVTGFRFLKFQIFSFQDNLKSKIKHFVLL